MALGVGDIDLFNQVQSIASPFGLPDRFRIMSSGKIVCSDHGTSSPIGVCRCNIGWRGDTCAEPTCIANCSGHGTCLSGTSTAVCACLPGFGGADCASRAVERLTSETTVPELSPVVAAYRRDAAGFAEPQESLSAAHAMGSLLLGLPKQAWAYASLLPAGTSMAFFGSGSLGAVRVTLGGRPRLEASASQSIAAVTDSGPMPRALQPEGGFDPRQDYKEASPAAAVDWVASRAYRAVRQATSTQHQRPVVQQIGVPHSLLHVFA